MAKKKKHKMFYGPNIDARFTFKVGRGKKAFRRTGLIHNKKHVAKGLRDLIQTFLGIPDDDFLEELKIPVGLENDKRYRRRR